MDLTKVVSNDILSYLMTDLFILTAEKFSYVIRLDEESNIIYVRLPFVIKHEIDICENDREYYISEDGKLYDQSHYTENDWTTNYIRSGVKEFYVFDYDESIKHYGEEFDMNIYTYLTENGSLHEISSNKLIFNDVLFVYNDIIYTKNSIIRPDEQIDLKYNMNNLEYDLNTRNSIQIRTDEGYVMIESDILIIDRVIDIIYTKNERIVFYDIPGFIWMEYYHEIFTNDKSVCILTEDCCYIISRDTDNRNIFLDDPDNIKLKLPGGYSKDTKVIGVKYGFLIHNNEYLYFTDESIFNEYNFSNMIVTMKYDNTIIYRYIHKVKSFDVSTSINIETHRGLYVHTDKINFGLSEPLNDYSKIRIFDSYIVTLVTMSGDLYVYDNNLILIHRGNVKRIIMSYIQSLDRVFYVTHLFINDNVYVSTKCVSYDDVAETKLYKVLINKSGKMGAKKEVPNEYLSTTHEYIELFGKPIKMDLNDIDIDSFYLNSHLCR